MSQAEGTQLPGFWQGQVGGWALLYVLILIPAFPHLRAWNSCLQHMGGDFSISGKRRVAAIAALCKRPLGFFTAFFMASA